MKKTDVLTEEFKLKYEKFLIGCDALEELEAWDLEEYGEMDVFFQNEMVCVILRLIAADGEIGEAEAAFLNDYFGFTFTAEELTDVYENCRDQILRPADEGIGNGAAVLRAANEKLADAYAELLALICSIVIECDDRVTPEELEEAKKLKKLFELR
jgi:hypothetical protein